MSVANQRMVIIHREERKRDFLSIKNVNWKAASRDLGATALRLYFYFASNREDFKLEFSPQAIENEIGMPKTTARDQFDKLIEKGYLVQINGNTYEFYEDPQKPKSSDIDNTNIPPKPTNNDNTPPQPVNNTTMQTRYVTIHSPRITPEKPKRNNDYLFKF